ncbi:MAG: hypothetical protein QM651_01170 [Rhodoblastus sp.]
MNVQIKPSKHSAPGQYLGFALQPVRAFYHLLTCPKGARVSLELQDDIAVHYADGSLCLEQTKSALKQNPISDWADDLWKTFHNWQSMISAGECKVGVTRFRLYVIPSKKGKFAQALAGASSAQEVEAVVSEIQQKLRKMKSPPACALHIQKFLDAPKDQQIAIVANFELETVSSDPLDAIRTVLSPTLDENNIDILAKSGIGQAKQAFDRLIQYGKMPILDADAFRQDFHAFIRRNNLPGLLTSVVEAPSSDWVAHVAATRPVFIRQLELVDVSHEDRLRAVSDFLRTSADKADWAERGLIFSGSLDGWNEDLVRRHSMVKGDVADLHGDKPLAVQGRIVYRQCAQHQAPLEGRVVPGHFVHGSFNDLSDRKRIGWHSDYKLLIDGDAG